MIIPILQVRKPRFSGYITRPRSHGERRQGWQSAQALLQSCRIHEAPSPSPTAGSLPLLPSWASSTLPSAFCSHQGGRKHLAQFLSRGKIHFQAPRLAHDPRNRPHSFLGPRACWCQEVAWMLATPGLISFSRSLRDAYCPHVTSGETEALACVVGEEGGREIHWFAQVSKSGFKRELQSLWP